jgi:hypothetical protein
MADLGSRSSTRAREGRKVAGRSICGATTRQGHPCRMTKVYRSGRCKLHGGLSTGPKTEVGRERAMANLRQRWGARTVSNAVTTETL